MKSSITFIVCALLLNQLTVAQDSLPQKHVVFRAKVKTYDGHVKTGCLQAIADSIISLSDKKSLLRFYRDDDHGSSSFNVASLDRVQLHRKGSVGRGIWGGALIGFATGFIAGIVQGNDEDKTVQIPNIFGGGYDTYVVKGTTASQKGMLLGATGILGGVIIGAIIGAASHNKFIIRGKKENYEKMRKKMMAKLGL